LYLYFPLHPALYTAPGRNRNLRALHIESDLQTLDVAAQGLSENQITGFLQRNSLIFMLCCAVKAWWFVRKPQA